MRYTNRRPTFTLPLDCCMTEQIMPSNNCIMRSSISHTDKQLELWCSQQLHHRPNYTISITSLIQFTPVTLLFLLCTIVIVCCYCTLSFLYCTFIIYPAIRLSSRKCAINSVFCVSRWWSRKHAMIWFSTQIYRPNEQTHELYQSDVRLWLLNGRIMQKVQTRDLYICTKWIKINRNAKKTA